LSTPHDVLTAAIQEDIKAGDLLNVAQTAAFLQKHPEYVRALIRSGKLIAVKHGASRSPWMIPKASLVAYFDTFSNL
jgi:3-deoxy-D-manno-octulosonic acid (KDO) 8-phosphate synthase